jgi:hypothetical protein
VLNVDFDWIFSRFPLQEVETAGGICRCHTLKASIDGIESNGSAGDGGARRIDNGAYNGAGGFTLAVEKLDRRKNCDRGQMALI